MGVRTDLAMEAHSLFKEDRNIKTDIDGVSSAVERYGEITLTRVNITNEEGSRNLKKAIGRYVTIEAPNIKYDSDEFIKACEILSEEIEVIADIKSNDVTLVVGLGNRDITPDALGVKTVENLMVTRHLKEYVKDMLPENISNVCAIAPGVLGTTGIETVRIIEGIVKIVKPKLVIAVDALAAADIKRVSTTIQLSDTGIQPGAGVGNNREGINEETLGTKVIAIGVPTVIDAETISKVEIPKELAPLMVTTKDIDTVIERMSKAVATGINLALHKGITVDEIENYIG